MSAVESPYVTDAPAKERHATRSFGELFFGAPPVQKMVQRARDELARCVDESVVRIGVRETAASEGMAASRILFPGMNRNARRLSLERVVRALINFYSDWRRTKHLGDAVDALALRRRLGFDD